MSNNFKRNYIIAGLGIGIHTPWEEIFSKEFAPFATSETEAGWQVYFEKKDRLSKTYGEKVFESHAFSIYKNEDGTYQRRFHDARKGDNEYAVVYTESENRRIFIECLTERLCHFGDSRKDFFHIGWEKILIHEGRMILHSACVDTPLGGILFSGPSGIGKSTQAGLWCEHAQAKLINGDRPVLYKAEEGWKACGSPYAGSSKCHLNEKCDIRAIVMLKQSEKCSIRKLAMSEAFRKVFEQTTVNSWDEIYVAKVCDLVMELVGEIPVYELSCTKDQEAVNLLMHELGREA